MSRHYARRVKRRPCRPWNLHHIGPIAIDGDLTTCADAAGYGRSHVFGRCERCGGVALARPAGNS